jgi:uncharacterized RDD family membrane protein YckC
MSSPGNLSTRLVTPEAVPLDVDVAGLGSRGLAIFVDGMIQFALFFLFLLIVSGFNLNGAAGVAVVSVGAFIVFWGYFFAFEGLWHGQTPGKRTQRLRVIGSDGQPIGFQAVFVRNLIRVVDFLPTAYAVGAATMVINGRSQRLGDLAAGTIVVRERKLTAPAALWMPPPPPMPAGPGQPVLDAMGMSEAQYALARSFLQRRAGLDPQARIALAAQVASAIRPSVAGAMPQAPGGDEGFIEAAAAAYQSRFRPA